MTEPLWSNPRLVVRPGDAALSFYPKPFDGPIRPGTGAG